MLWLTYVMADLRYDWLMLWLAYVMADLCYGWLMLWFAYVMVGLCYGCRMLWLAYVMAGLCYGWLMLWLAYVMARLCYGWLMLWLAYVMADLCYGWLCYDWLMLWLAYVMADLCYAERSFLTCVVLSPQVFEQNHYFFGFTKIVFFLFGLTSQILHQDSQDAPSNSLFCNVLSCRQSFSGAPVIAKKSKSKYMGSCSLLRFIARGTTFCKFAWRRYLVNVRCFCTSWNCRGVLGKVHKVS